MYNHTVLKQEFGDKLKSELVICNLHSTKKKITFAITVERLTALTFVTELMPIQG